MIPEFAVCGASIGLAAIAWFTVAAVSDPSRPIYIGATAAGVTLGALAIYLFVLAFPLREPEDTSERNRR